MDFTHSCVCVCVCVGGDAAEEKLEEDGGVENEWNRSEFLYALILGIIQVITTNKQLRAHHTLIFKHYI